MTVYCSLCDHNVEATVFLTDDQVYHYKELDAVCSKHRDHWLVRGMVEISEEDYMLELLKESI